MTEPAKSLPERRPDGNRPSRIRTGSVFVRAAHLLAASAVAGGYLLGTASPAGRAWWIAAGVTGAVLLVAEFLQHRELHREFAGWSTLLKLVLIGAIPVTPAVAAPWLMSAAFAVAVVGAHAPRRWRHRRVF